MNHQAINSALDFLPQAPESRLTTLAKRLGRQLTGLAAGARAGREAHETYKRLRAAGATSETAARRAIATLR